MPTSRRRCGGSCPAGRTPRWTPPVPVSALSPRFATAAASSPWWAARTRRPLRGITVHHEWIHADAKTLARLAAQQLTIRVADTLPLHAAAEAHSRLAAGGFSGRLVLTP
nr:zinc-binding dehydrogenase [Nocardia cyriacigeorgica]